MKNHQSYLRFRLVHRIKEHYGGVSSVSIGDDGTIFASGSSDKTIKIYNSSSCQCVKVLRGHKSGVNSIHFGSDRNLLISGGDDTRVRLWDIVKGKCVISFRKHSGFVNSVCFNTPKNNLILSCSADESAILWDKVSGRMLRKLPAHTNNVSGGSFTSDGTLISTCGYDGLIRLWDTKSGQCLKSLQCGDKINVGSCGFTPNDRYVVGSYFDSTIKCWDYHRGKVVREYRGKPNEKFALDQKFFRLKERDMEGNETGNEGSFLLSGGEDGNMYTWDVNYGRRIFLRITGAHEGVILTVDSHRSRNLFISGSLDNTVGVWENLKAPSDFQKE